MIVYKAIRTNFSFYTEAETHTKEDWKRKLDLTDGEFTEIAKTDFEEIDTQEIIFEVVKTQPLGQRQIVIRKNSESAGLTDDELNILTPLITRMLEDFNSTEEEPK